MHARAATPLAWLVLAQLLAGTTATAGPIAAPTTVAPTANPAAAPVTVAPTLQASPEGHGCEVLYEALDFRMYQSGKPTVFSGTYIIIVLQYVYYTGLILQFCGRSINR